MIERNITVDLPTAAAMSSLSKRTLQNYIRAKRLRALKIGKRTLIRVRDLESFLQNDQPFAEGNEIRSERELAEDSRKLLASPELSSFEN